MGNQTLRIRGLGDPSPSRLRLALGSSGRVLCPLPHDLSIQISISKVSLTLVSVRRRLSTRLENVPYRRFPPRYLLPRGSPKIEQSSCQRILSGKKQNKTKQETVEFTIQPTYRAPHNPIVILRGIKNRKLFRNLFPSAGFDLAFAKRHSLVDKFSGFALRLRGGPESRLGVNSGFPPRHNDGN